ncbi:MAG: hypothetical protein AAB564_02510 [Patescibacteria group bacterium]
MEADNNSSGEKIIIIVFLVILFVLLSALAINKGVRSDAENECLKWQNQAEKIAGFYITQKQKIQCDFIGIRINAPVYPVKK